MADNVNITPGTGATVASDDIGGGVQVQRVKATWGPDGTANDASHATPLPVMAGVTAIGNGRKTVTTAGTPVALATTTAARQVIVTALEGNTGVVCVGGTGVAAAVATRTGTPLWPRDTLTLDIKDLADVFIDATVSGEGVSFTYIA